MSTAIFMDSGKRKHNSRTARSYSLIKTTEAAPAVLKNARFKKQQLIFDLLLLFFIHLNFFSLNPPSAHSDRSFSTRHPHNAHPSPAARRNPLGFPFLSHCFAQGPIRRPPCPRRKISGEAMSLPFRSSSESSRSRRTSPGKHLRSRQPPRSPRKNSTEG